MRVFIIFSKWLVLCIDSPENKLLIKLMRGIEIFYYMGCILYQHYFVILHPPKDGEDLFVYRAKLFMVIEVILFYALIMTTIAFLGYIQVRGMLGRKDYENNRNRYKFDALDYYEADINWLQFQLAPIIIACFVLLWRKVFNLNYLGDFDMLMMGAIITQRVFQLILFSPFRGQDKQILPVHMGQWFFLACIEGGAFTMYMLQEHTNGTSMVCVIDVIVFILQFLFQW